MRLWTLAMMATLAACSAQGPRDNTVEAEQPAAASSAPPSAATNPPIPKAAAVDPGVSLDQPAVVATGTAVAGAIVANGPSNFYRFDNAASQRDIFLVRLDNKSPTLKPQIKLYDANRSQIVDRYDYTPGASVQQLIALDRGQTIYAEVVPFGSAGAYELSITPQKAYDANEPNDDQLTPKVVAFGAPIAGAVMDERDSDWFRITGAQAAKINVVLENQSTTLKPHVKVYSSTKSEKRDAYDTTPGAGLDFAVDIEAGKDFYVQVVPYGSTGKYALSLKPVQ